MCHNLMCHNLTCHNLMCHNLMCHNLMCHNLMCHILMCQAGPYHGMDGEPGQHYISRERNTPHPTPPHHAHNRLQLA